MKMMKDPNSWPRFLSVDSLSRSTRYRSPFIKMSRTFVVHVGDKWNTSEIMMEQKPAGRDK